MSQILDIDVPSGAILEMTNGTSRPQHYRFECGEYGFVEFVLPIGGLFRFKPGKVLPKIIVDDVDDQIFEGNNVVRINNVNQKP